jgi:hypothetical protein
MNKKPRISGVTIVKNAIEFDYPVIECIRSLLPLVDEMIVSIGDGTDETETAVQSIGSSKIKIVHSVWDPHLTTGGTILAAETDKAMRHVSKEADWIFYLQADEVIHENDYPLIFDACNLYLENMKVEGFLFNYIHFYGSFDYFGDSRRWYNREIRIIRNNQGIQSYRDAQGFRKNNRKLQVKKLDARIFHYGWVRNPNAQTKKLATFYTFWGAHENKKDISAEMYDYLKNADSLALFQGTHPACMHDRILRKNWDLKFDTNRKNFKCKDHFLYQFEKITGIRPFDYKNYKII